MLYPIGIQTFEALRTEGYVYVDKTEYIYRLATTGKCYFLSRPRRFGKSMLVSTLKAYFSGRKDLFEGLAVEKLEKNWIKYPVLNLNMSEGKVTNSVDSLYKTIDNALTEWERFYGTGPAEEDPELRFKGIIRRAYEKTGRKAVILIDEYDKPLLDTIDNDQEHDKVRDLLKGFYGNVKTQDEYIKFVFLTGVTKFSHVSIFSGLNNLKDISMDLRYAGICGITEQEIHTYFEESLHEFAESTGRTYEQACDALKTQYDGYHFHPKGVGVYNPFSLFNAFDSGELGDYWFKTATPSFLVKLLLKNDYNLRLLENVSQTETSLSDLSTMDINPIPVLYQSGYLTIHGYNERFRKYILGFPNREVETGFIDYLVPFYFSSKAKLRPDDFVEQAVSDLESGDAEGFLRRLQVFYYGNDYRIVGDAEIYYQCSLFLLLRMIGTSVEPEKASSAGRADLVVETSRYVYIMELKLDGSAEAALQQIEDRGYARPYALDPRKVFKIGVNFSSADRSVDKWVIAQ